MAGITPSGVLTLQEGTDVEVCAQLISPDEARVKRFTAFQFEDTEETAKSLFLIPLVLYSIHTHTYIYTPYFLD